MSSPRTRDRRGPAWLQVALYQLAAVLGAFLLAGMLINLSIRNLTLDQVHARVMGEVGTLDDEVIQKGANHLFHTVDKRSRQARGFVYRLSSSDGSVISGRLASVQLPDGWSTASAPGVAARVLCWTKTIPNRARLSVCESLHEEELLEAAVGQTLIFSGVLGLAFFLIASFILQRDSWRRLSGVIRAAGDVGRGRMDVRVPSRRETPRDDIDELVFAFNGMLNEIGTLVTRIRHVSNDIAHDMRTPLGRVRQRVERLAAGLADQSISRREALAIEDDLRDVLQTFDAMLKLSEFETGLDASFLQPVDLSDVVQRVADAYRGDIEAQGRTFEVAVQTVSVRANEQLVAQALSNLLENALRHTRAGVFMGIELARTDKSAILTVFDRGEGVPADLRTTVVERFRRLDPARSGRGAGLGLAIVAAIAKCHGASLQLADAHPGLRVSVCFPD